MSTKAREQLKSSTTANQADKLNSSEPLITNEAYQGNVRIVGSDQHGYWLGLGNYQITPPKPDKQTAIEYAKDNPIEVMENIAIAVHSILTTAMQKTKTAE